MAGRLSSSKVSRIFQLHFRGYSQCAIARWLNIHQSTVSIYINRLTTLAQEEGLETAARRYGVMQEIRELHSLAAELKRARLTVAESRTGLRVLDTLKSHSVAEDDYGDLIESTKKMKSDGFMEAAIELSQLERASGLNYEQVCASYQGSYKQVQQLEKELAGKTRELERSESAFMSAEMNRKAAESGFESYLKETAMDMKRLQKVEPLALALKKAAVQDSQLDEYIQRQQLLDRSGVSLNLLSSILKQANVVTAHDTGKTFVDMLTQYGGLARATEALQDKIKVLEKSADGLDQKLQIKKNTETEITQLKKQKGNLEKEVAQHSTEKEALISQKSASQKDIRSLAQQKAELEQNISEQQKLRESLRTDNETLSSEINTKKDQLSDLAQLEAKRSAMLASLAETDESLGQRRKQQDVLDSFIGLIDQPSFDELKKFAGSIPYLINKAKQQNEPPKLLTDYVFEKITAGKLKPQRCSSCYATFAADKPPKGSLGYHCPVCDSILVKEILTNESAMLKGAVAETRIRKFVPVLKPAENQKTNQNDKPSA
jgi:predicted transcriptional regulator